MGPGKDNDKNDEIPPSLLSFPLKMNSGVIVRQSSYVPVIRLLVTGRRKIATFFFFLEAARSNESGLGHENWTLCLEIGAGSLSDVVFVKELVLVAGSLAGNNGKGVCISSHPSSPPPILKQFLHVDFVNAVAVATPISYIHDDVGVRK